MFVHYKNMKISTLNVLNNSGISSQRKDAANSLASKGKSAPYQNNAITQIENPFANHLNFTGGINKLSVLKTNSLESLLHDLTGFKGDNVEFAKHTFDKFKKHFGYEDLMADNLQMVDRAKNESFVARFNDRTGEFQMDKQTCLSISRGEIASVLRHEFEHFFQFGRMFRSEEIGIEKYLKEETISIVKKVDKEAYILGEEINPQERQKYLDSSSVDVSMMNMDFWTKIIARKGILKKDTAEAVQAKEEFEALMEYKPYINASELKDYSGLPKFQETIYYDAHEIGVMDNYWNNPIEIGARKEEKFLLESYLKLTKEPYTPHPLMVEDQGTFGGINRLMNTFQEKFKSNNLPDRFKAFVYDGIVSKFLKDSNRNPYVKDCIQEASKTIKGLSESEVKIELITFKKMMEKGYMRLSSKEETDDFMKLVSEFTDVHNFDKTHKKIN